MSPKLEIRGRKEECWRRVRGEVVFQETGRMKGGRKCCRMGAGPTEVAIHLKKPVRMVVCVFPQLSSAVPVQVQNGLSVGLDPEWGLAKQVNRERKEKGHSG